MQGPRPSTGNEANAEWRVPGKQTAVRAELYAVLRVLQTDSRRLSVRTDCRIVAAGVTEWRPRWRAAAWLRAPLKGQTIPHVDLWRKVDRCLEERQEPVEVLWTKGHPLPRHMWHGVTTEIDAWANYAVDGLATNALERARASGVGELVQR